MSTNKITAERNQKILAGLAVKPGNDICADCKARNPRWASHNLGIFICVTCATIHRKIGTHVTKVKSITMDTWSKEQVDRMVEMGNVKSNTIYCPNEVRHPPPMQLMEQERDSELEQYIRSKYEYKRFIEKPKPAESTSRSQSTPLDNAPKPSSSSLSSSGVAARPSTAAIPSATAVAPARSFSQPMPSSIPNSQPRNVSQPLNQYQHPVRQQSLAPTSALAKPPEAPKGGVWDDLVSLQTPSTNSSLPLQYSQQPAGSFSGISSPPMLSPPLGMNSANQFNTMGGFSGGGMMTNPMGMPMSMSMGNMNTGVGMMSSNPFPQSSQFQASNSFGSQQSFGNMGLGGMQQQQQTLFPNQSQVRSPQPTFAAQAGGGASGQVWGVPGHSPQPMMSTTPNPMMSTTPQLPGQFMSPSPHLQTQSPSQFGGMGAGMNMGTQQGVGGMTTGMGGMSGMGTTGFQQQPQMFAGGNPGAGWAQSQGGFGQTQQQWGTM